MCHSCANMIVLYTKIMDYVSFLLCNMIVLYTKIIDCVILVEHFQFFTQKDKCLP